MVTIIISDNGRGFNPGSLKNKKNIGISNVRERLLISYSKSKKKSAAKQEGGQR